MEELRIGPWRVRYDAAATRRAYERIRHGGAEECRCSTCRNYIAARSSAFPAEFLRLLERLGVDPAKERESYYVQAAAPGRHVYSGWFHFVGEVVEGPAEVLALGERFHFYITNETALVPEAFAGKAVAQIEFTTEVPWVTRDAEPQAMG